MVRFGARAPGPPAREVVKLMARAGLDAGARRRRRGRLGPATGPPTVGGRCRRAGVRAGLGASEGARRGAGVGASLVGRAGLGLSWMRLAEAPAERSAAIGSVAPRAAASVPCVVLDAPERCGRRSRCGAGDGPVPLMRRVKARFDRAGVCNPGIFVEGSDGDSTARPGAGPACTAGSACRPARPTCCGTRRWTRPRPHRADERGRWRTGTDLSAMVTHWDRCLGCMACVTACPSGVRYDRLIEATRPQVEAVYEPQLAGPRLPSLRLRDLHPPGRLRPLGPHGRLVPASRRRPTGWPASPAWLPGPPAPRPGPVGQAAAVGDHRARRGGAATRTRSGCCSDACSGCSSTT